MKLLRKYDARILGEHSDSLLNVKKYVSERHKDKINLVVTLGGDGTLLWATGLFKIGPMPPVVSFNYGSVGFMTCYSYDEYHTVLNEIMTSRQLLVDLKRRIECYAVTEGVRTYFG